jgi:hypothetical protein
MKVRTTIIFTPRFIQFVNLKHCGLRAKDTS